MPRAEQIRDMFSGIAGKYDLANHALSLGVDYYWRKVLVRSVAGERPRRVVDLATGSGDVAIALKRRLGPEVEVSGLDFCQPMLDEANRKKRRLPLTREMQFAPGDCLDLPLETESIDVLTIAFGLRNLEDRDAGLREMLRVLRPGGCLFVLEFTQPRPWFKPFYFVYLKAILPLFARLITRDREAYDYLAASIESFPSQRELTRQIQKAGFAAVSTRGLTASIVAIHRARKSG